MKQKTIALWMYRNEGGDIIQEKLKKLLEEKNIKVINDFDMRKCYCLEGRVYTEKGFDLSSVDVLYHMNADEQSPYQIEILRALELSGVKIINNFNAYNTARNKFMTNVLLKRHGFNVPPSLFINSKQALSMAGEIFKKWGKVLVKPTSRHGGKGIILFEELEQFEDFIETTKYSFDDYYLEKFIEFEDHDYRVEVFNGEVVYSIGREKKLHSYKTNTHSGGTYIHLSAPEEVKTTAIKAANILNMNSTIIDLGKSKKNGGFYIIEINALMGIFIEEYQKIHSEIFDSSFFGNAFNYDDVKLKVLSKYLISSIK